MPSRAPRNCIENASIVKRKLTFLKNLRDYFQKLSHLEKMQYIFITDSDYANTDTSFQYLL